MPRSLRRVLRRVEATVQRSARSTFPTHNKTRHVNNNIINVMGSSSADRRTHGHRDRGTQRETARHYGRTETGTERLRGFCCLVLFCSFGFCLVLFGSVVCPFQKGFKRRFVIVSMCVRVCVPVCVCVCITPGDLERVMYAFHVFYAIVWLSFSSVFYSAGRRGSSSDCLTD